MADNGKFRIGVLGATGLVGTEILAILEERQFPCDEMLVFGTEDSRAIRLDWRGDTDGLKVETVDPGILATCQLIFGAAPEGVAKKWLQRSLERGSVVIDCSPAFRQTNDVPLVVCGVNTSELDEEIRWIASPGSATSLISPVVDVVRRLSVPIELQCTVFVPASHYGRAGMAELSAQTVGLLNQTEFQATVFPDRIAFNVHGMVGPVPRGRDFSEMESQTIGEIKKVLDEQELDVDIFAVQVPVFSGISAHISMLCVEPVSRDALLAEIGDSVRFRLFNADEHPTLDQVSQRDDIQIARIRLGNGGRRVSLWAATDNLRRGSALNAVEIAEQYATEGWFPALKGRPGVPVVRTLRVI